LAERWKPCDRPISDVSGASSREIPLSGSSSASTPSAPRPLEAAMWRWAAERMPVFTAQLCGLGPSYVGYQYAAAAYA